MPKPDTAANTLILMLGQLVGYIMNKHNLHEVAVLNIIVNVARSRLYEIDLQER